MRTLQNWLDEYSISHQNPLNKKIHWICVPLITASLIGIIWSISPVVALLILVLMLVFYVRLSIPLFFVMALFSAIVVVFVVILSGPLTTALSTPIWFYIGLFVIGWIGQFYGHKVEGKKPSFFKDLQFLLIGPAWCASYLMKKIKLAP
ncbi:DUF962 domain-containing protein [Aquirhabdus sp.]|uniref:Mpo1 family 2-hydroxy fatty acid dioxygenase n=1 Tax=Aquirhabdus sp. TaxID=2824160 RepID=UPI00396D0207